MEAEKDSRKQKSTTPTIGSKEYKVFSLRRGLEAQIPARCGMSIMHYVSSNDTDKLTQGEVRRSQAGVGRACQEARRAPQGNQGDGILEVARRASREVQKAWAVLRCLLGRL